MLSDEEWKAINNLNFIIVTDIYDNEVRIDKTKIINEYNESVGIVLNLIRKQSKEIEELKETLKCTQNSWFEDTQKIEEMKKQIDLDNECEIALNNKIMDLEKEIEELKEESKEYQIGFAQGCYEKDLDWEDKIKAKIEELDKQEKEVLKGTKGQDRYAIKQEYMHKRSALQSLLEKE